MIKSQSGETDATMDLEIYQDDSMVFNSKAPGQNKVNCSIEACCYKDTVTVICDAGILSGFGYKILLWKDTCVVTHHTRSEANILKLHKEDSLGNCLNVPCTSYHLTLSRHPSFTTGESLYGIVELTSADYYEVNVHPHKFHVHLKSWFRTPTIEGTGKK